MREESIRAIGLIKRKLNTPSVFKQENAYTASSKHPHKDTFSWKRNSVANITKGSKSEI